MSVRIERYHQAHLPALLSFLRASYPDSPLKADERYFRWRFNDDPRGSSLDYYFLALDDQRVVGQWCGLIDRVWRQGAWCEAIWLVDLMVDPQYRRSSALVGLAKAAMNSGRLCLAVGADEHVVPLYEALRWRRFRPMETYFAPLRPSRLARLAATTGRSPGVPPWLGPVLRVGDAVGPALRRVRLALRGAPREVRINSLDAPLAASEGLDDWLQRTTRQFDRTTERTAAILDWKFHRRPTGSHFAMAARDARDGRWRGYMISKSMQRDGVLWAEVADFLVAPGDRAALNALVDATVRRALDHDADFLRLRCGLPEHGALLHRPWWIHKTTPVVDEVFAFSADAGLLADLAAGSWHLTGLASDRVDYGRDDYISKDV